ncbi:type VI secretion system tip protein VgrG [Aquimarina sp. BL5]|uniref:type VI secretion system tip protein VgrG n=1 Tax=Aquimarina sp. BL5 TaxID=1714860 RepID=UPI000E535235|nr:type VI secretion system tip protein VgrG [Aquimarina sp. BL5]AXT53603.1 type VI secretion system tip protein VgrG [Aquimarina sp. BL5]RKN03874.1 type VI secretion system tip protein VgrG [Aquimarina sp. BL5]
MALIDLNTPQGTELATYRILVDGTELEGAFTVRSIATTKAINKIPTAHIELLDGSVAAADFTSSNEDILIPGNEMEIKMGYQGDEETVFKGIIIKHGIKTLGTNANSLLIIEAKDLAIKTTIGRKNRYFSEVTDSEMIETILGDYSDLSIEIEATTNTQEQMVQYYCSDWDFLVTRAEANGHLIMVDDATIKTSAPDYAQEPVASLAYGHNILEFDFEMDARNQFSTIETRSWDISNQEVITSSNKPQDITELGNITSSDLSDTIGLDPLNFQHTGLLNPEELQSWTNARMLRSQLSKIIGRVKILGNNQIKPGNLITIDGLGERFNGTAFVASVSHSFASNWNTHLQIGLSQKFLTECYDDVQAIPSSSLLPAISGLHIAKVSAIHDDPLGENRIKIKLPLISTEDEGTWARIATLDASENRGSFFLPEIDDEVIVGFLNDDPRNPIIIGMVHSSANPAPFEATEENDEKGIVTRSEMKLVFDDGKNHILLETPNGNKVLLSEDEAAIQIEDENGHKVTLDGDGILLDSKGDVNIKASGDVNIEGANINIKAQSAFKAEGSSGAEVSSSASTVIKGSIVQIN